jgi:hypothetical protein
MGDAASDVARLQAEVRELRQIMDRWARAFGAVAQTSPTAHADVSEGISRWKDERRQQGDQAPRGRKRQGLRVPQKDEGQARIAPPPAARNG